MTATEAVDVLVAGGGTGGVAAALAAARLGARVTLTEPTKWLGGQLTSQAVPPDEHISIETAGCTAAYRAFRDGVREYYRQRFPLSDGARAARHLNPGGGWVSPVCHEPRVAVAVLDAMLAPYRAAGLLTVHAEHEPVAADVDGDTVRAVRFRSRADGSERIVEAAYVLDATETGDLLPLTGTEYVTGFESAAETGEPDAPADAQPLNMQAITWCMAVEHRPGEDHTIDRPAGYDFWRAYRHPAWAGRPLLSWYGPGERPAGYRMDPDPDDDPQAAYIDHRRIPPRPDLWTYRRVVARRTFRPGTCDNDVTILNWPMNDYPVGPVFEVPAEDAERHLAGARDLTLSLLYWLQTEAGYPGLRPRGDVTGTPDGLAMAPYIRESRRIRAVTTVVAHDVLVSLRGDHGARGFPDSVGIGHYYWMDLHPSTGGDGGLGGVPHPFEIPLGTLLPVRMRNLLPAAKNIGTTHLTNGCYRVHPVEWAVGEAAGTLAAHCLDAGLTPHGVRDDPSRLEDFQQLLSKLGVPIRWPGRTAG
ncbi:FAD-dependent oxidoreductase [Microbispora sp. CA-102843]|uniref:FAD-dependent oxidoreductase n=1 Tax=Microbispora sp. CA-102843 TaxID=3239952 RepID=UPI003D94780F